MKNLMFYKLLIVMYLLNGGIRLYTQTNLQLFKKADYDIISNNKLFAGIDFYNANEVTLYRELRSDEITTANGVLKVVNNIRYEYIILPKRNVGRYYYTSDYKHLKISFDARHPEKAFTFEMMRSKDGDELFYLATYKEFDGSLTIRYAGENYKILIGPGFDDKGVNYVYLLYDNVKNTNKTTQTDTLKSFPSRRN